MLQGQRHVAAEIKCEQWAESETGRENLKEKDGQRHSQSQMEVETWKGSRKKTE